MPLVIFKRKVYKLSSNNIVTMTEYKQPTEYVLRSRVDQESGKVTHDIPKEAGVWVGDILDQYRAFAKKTLSPREGAIVTIDSLEVRLTGKADLSD